MLILYKIFKYWGINNLRMYYYMRCPLEIIFCLFDLMRDNYKVRSIKYSYTK